MKRTTEPLNLDFGSGKIIWMYSEIHEMTYTNLAHDMVLLKQGKSAQYRDFFKSSIRGPFTNMPSDL